MCSRLGFDQRGRRTVVQTTPEVGITVGTTFVVIGNSFPVAEIGVSWLGRSGRRPSAQEMKETVAPSLRELLHQGS